MKRFGLPLLLLAFVTADAGAREKLRVYVHTIESGKDPSGFVLPKPDGDMYDRDGAPKIEDSKKDIEKRLAKSKWVVPVGPNPDFHIEVLVIHRGWEDVNSYSIQTLPGYGTTVSRDRNRFVAVQLLVDEEVITTLQNRPGVMSWGQAAGQVTDQIEEFVEANYDRLIEQRPE